MAENLSKLGFSVELCPLLEIEPLAAGSYLKQHLDDVAKRIAQFALVIFVSPNAIQAFLKNDQNPLPLVLSARGAG